MVTLNHRLNVFGYLYLAHLDGETGGLGNVGMLDIVQALQWVRDNAAEFGGDPGNVTIFGQSAGAGRSDADGHARRGGPVPPGHRPERIQRHRHTARRRDADGSNAFRTSESEAKSGRPIDRLSTDQLLGALRGLNFSPVVDGKNLPAGPFYGVVAVVRERSAAVRLDGDRSRVGTRRPARRHGRRGAHDAVETGIRGVSDADIARLIAAYRKGRPRISNVDLYLILASDNTMREGVMSVAERKAEAKQAPVYMVLLHVALARA